MSEYGKTFSEYMVKHERTNNELMTPVIGISVLIFLVFFLSGVFFAFIPSYAPYLAVTLLFIFFNLAKTLLSRANLEFEYILAEGEMDIDKIINRKSRKTILTFRCADIIKMDKIGNDVDAYKQILAQNRKKVLANGPIVSKNTYYALIPTEKGRVLLLFDPPEELILAMQKHNKENINL